MKPILTIMLFLIHATLFSQTLKLELTSDSAVNGEMICHAVNRGSVDTIFLSAGTCLLNLTIRENISIYGGFSGNSAYWDHESTRDSKLTIFCGYNTFDFKNKNDYETSSFLDANEFPKSVIYIPYSDSIGSVTISDLTITNGSGSEYNGITAGGGIFIDTRYSSQCKVKNCIIKRNLSHVGGGIFGGEVINSIIKDNFAGHGGGGAFCSIRESRIKNNRAILFGGGLIGATLEKCEIRRNVASHGGGGYQVNAKSSNFYANKARLFGGGVYGSVVCNSFFKNNSVDESGGSEASGSTLDGCVFNANTNRVLLRDCKLVKCLFNKLIYSGDNVTIETPLP